MSGKDSEIRFNLRLQLSSEHDSVRRAVDETRSFVGEHVEDDDLAYRIVLVVSEAVANAVEHGNEYDQDKQVRVELQWGDAAGMTIVVEDEGAGFDSSAASSMLPEEVTREDGRGLFIIHEMADDVRYENEGRRLHARLRRTE